MLLPFSRSVTLALLTTATLAAVGCGDDTSDGSGGTSSAAEGGSTSSGDGGSSSAETTGSGGAGGADAAVTSSTSTGSGGAAPSGPYASIVFINNEYDIGEGPVRSGLFNAKFSEVVDAGTPCDREDLGTCTRWRCSGPTDVVEARYPDQLTITGARTSIQPGLDPENESLTFSHDDFVYERGATLGVASTGGEVPAFSVSVVAPAHATLIAPDLQGLIVDRSVDLPVTWTTEGDGGGELSVQLSIDDVTGSLRQRVDCRFPLADGEGVIPAALLGDLPASTLGRFIAFEIGDTTTEVEGWSIFVSALQVATAETPFHTASVDEVTIE